MKLNTSITLLLTAFGVILLSGCQSNTVYFASHYAHSIEHVPAKGGKPQVLIPGPAMVMGLACSSTEQRLYLADQRWIARWRMDGKSDGAVLSAEHIRGIALDEKAGRLYWAEQGSPLEAGRGTVMSSNLQGGDRRVLVSNLAYPKVAVNPSKGLLYWTDHTSNDKRKPAALEALKKSLLHLAFTGEL